jgi:hypothetical protein
VPFFDCNAGGRRPLVAGDRGGAFFFVVFFAADFFGAVLLGFFIT